jgi:16S rRNA U516 pseudouridylate synthase RsuA-like enzyme
MHIELGDLKIGQWRDLSAAETDALLTQCAGLHEAATVR